MSAEQPRNKVFERPITDAEIDELLNGVTQEVPAQENLVEALRHELEDSFSGVKLEDLQGRIGSLTQEVITPEEIDANPDLLSAIEKSIKRTDFVKKIFTAWGATLLRGDDGAWLVNIPGRKSPLPLERVLRGIRNEVLKPMVEAQKAQRGGAGGKPFSPIS